MRHHEYIRLQDIALAEHGLGHAKESQLELDERMAKDAKAWAYEVGEVYAWRDEKDQAFKWWERSYRQRHGGLSEVKGDLLLDSLRGDPRHKLFLRKINLPE